MARLLVELLRGLGDVVEDLADLAHQDRLEQAAVHQEVVERAGRAWPPPAGGTRGRARPVRSSSPRRPGRRRACSRGRPASGRWPKYDEAPLARAAGHDLRLSAEALAALPRKRVAVGVEVLRLVRHLLQVAQQARGQRQVAEQPLHPPRAQLQPALDRIHDAIAAAEEPVEAEAEVTLRPHAAREEPPRLRAPRLVVARPRRRRADSAAEQNGLRRAAARTAPGSSSTRAAKPRTAPAAAAKPRGRRRQPQRARPPVRRRHPTVSGRTRASSPLLALRWPSRARATRMGVVADRAGRLRRRSGCTARRAGFMSTRPAEAESPSSRTRMATTRGRAAARYVCAEPSRAVPAQAARRRGGHPRRAVWRARSGSGAVDVSFHPAGHVLGSAQVRLEAGGEVWVVSGDYKRAADPDLRAVRGRALRRVRHRGHFRAADLPLGRAGRGRARHVRMVGAQPRGGRRFRPLLLRDGEGAAGPGRAGAPDRPPGARPRRRARR